MTTSRPTPKAAELANVAEEVRQEASELLAAAGSSEQAKRAVDSAVGNLAEPTTDNDAFALQCGFGSYLELFEAAKPLGEFDGKSWFVSNAGQNQWIVWNDQELVISHKAESFEAASKFSQQAMKQKTSSADSPPQA